MCRIDSELQKRTQLCLLVCGKNIDLTAEETSAQVLGAPGCEFGDPINLVAMLGAANGTLPGDGQLSTLDGLI